MPAVNFITNTDIIDKTGISETTLDNFIILGIIPKPIARPSGSIEKGARHSGYFPVDVLDRISKVRIVKQHSNFLDDITRLFKDTKEDGAAPVSYEITSKNILSPLVDKFLLLIRW